MALATNSTPGSIILGGDLTGVANAPELRLSGVNAGDYTFSNIVVDVKGRVIKAANGTDFTPTEISGEVSGPLQTTVLGDVSVTPGTYNHVDLTVDPQGRVTSAANGNTTYTMSGDISGNITNNTLNNTSVSPNSYNAATITVNSQGRITSASANSIVFAGDISGPLSAASIVSSGVAPGTVSGNAKFITVNSKGLITSTISSDIGLAGDLTGSLSANQLKTVGATDISGTYKNVVSLTVDPQGRVTAISSDDQSTSGDLRGFSNNLILQPTGVTPATYNLNGSVTIGADGRITSASSPTTFGGAMSGTIFNNTAVTTLASSGVTAGTYTVTDITVDSKGRITAAASGTAPVWGGDFTGSIGSASLKSSGVNSGVYTLPITTVNSQGLITSAANGYASYTTKGFATINANFGLSISSGVLSGTLANGSATYGVIKSADTTSITIDASGNVQTGANIPTLDAQNVYSVNQHYSASYTTLVGGNAFAPDQSHYQVENIVVINSPLNLTAPVNTIDGLTTHITLKSYSTDISTPVKGTTFGNSMLIGNTNTNIVWGNGKFVFASAGSGIPGTSNLRYSSDGLTWSNSSTPAAIVSCVAWNGSIFVALGDNVAFSSTDGVNWTTRTIASGLWRNVLWTGSKFIAFGAANAQTRYSTDGITWTVGGAAPAATYTGAIKAVAVSLSSSFPQIVIMYHDTTTNTVYVKYSLDSGSSWNTGYSVVDATAQPTALAYGNGRWLAKIGGGTNPDWVTSTNTTAWSTCNGPYQGATALVWTGGCFLATTGDIAQTSLDGTDGSWTTVNHHLDSGTTYQSYGYNSACYGDNKTLILAVRQDTLTQPFTVMATSLSVSASSDYKFSNTLPSGTTQAFLECTQVGSTTYCTYV